MIAHTVTNKKGETKRCIIKRKHIKFREISDSFNMDEAIKSYKFIFSSLINQNRYQEVLSKFGKIEEDNINEFINEFNDDVWTYFYEKYKFDGIVINDHDKAMIYTRKLCEIIVDDNIINNKIIE